MQTLNIQKKEEYHFFYAPQCPQTLTIVSNKKSILANLYSLASYFWVMPDKNQWGNIQQQFQNKVGEYLNCCQTIEDVKLKIQNHETVVIICQQSLLKNNINQLQQEIRSMKITRILCIGEQFYHFSKSIIYIQDFRKIFDEIIQNKFSYNKANDFINFIFVSKQIWDSSILIKTMFAMLQQKTNRKQMIQYMGEVAKVSCSPNKIHEVDNFVHKNIKSHNKFSNIIKWYTNQSFLYGFINSILRLCKDPTSIFVLQPYFKDLFLVIQLLFKKQQQKIQDQNYNYRSFYCYRGGGISEKEKENFKSNIGSIVENLGFLSASCSKEVANGFVINVLYQIEIFDEPRHCQIDFGFAFVEKYSSKKEEQQVIFNPLNTFKIIDVIQIQQGTLFMIKLKYGELARISACNKADLNNWEIKYKILAEYRIFQKNKYKHIDDILLQRDFNLKGCLEYCQKYMQIAHKSKKNANIIQGYYKLGKYYQNRAEYQKMIQNYSKIFELVKKNKESQDYFICLAKLGQSYLKLQKFQKTVQYLQQCLKALKKKIIIYDITDYVILWNNLSIAYFKLGKYQQALNNLLKIKKFHMSASGSSNQNYFAILNNIGAIYNRLHLYEKSIESLEESLELEVISVGEEHPRSIKKYLNLGAAYAKTNQFSKALQCFLKAESLQKKYYGQNTYEYLTAIQNLGIIYIYLDQIIISKSYIEKYKNLSKGKPNFQKQWANYLLCLAKVYIQQGKYKQGLQYLREGQIIYKTLEGKNSMKYINILIYLSNVLMALNQFQQAMQGLLEADFLQKKYYGWDKFHQSEILRTLGILYSKIGNISMAFCCLISTKKIYEGFLDIKTNKIYPKILGEIGYLFMISHEFQNAISYYEESLKIKKKICGKMHIEYFITLNNLGQCYKSCGQFKISLSKFKQLQTISMKIFGSEHPKYAEILNSQASVHSSLGQFQIAVELYQRSLVILRISLCQKHVLYLSTLSKLSVVLFDLGLYRQSMEVCLKCGDEQLVSKMAEILQKFAQIKSILSQYSLKVALILPPVKNVFSDIDEYMKNKNYNEAIKKIRWFRRICIIEFNNPQFSGLIEDFNRKQSEIMSIILTEISNYYEIADNLQKMGHYQQAELIYSEFILMKYKAVAFVIPEVFRKIEDDLQYLKSRNKKQQEIIGVDTLAEVEAEKFQFSYIDFQL